MNQQTIIVFLILLAVVAIIATPSIKRTTLRRTVYGVGGMLIVFAFILTAQALPLEQRAISIGIALLVFIASFVVMYRFVSKK